MGPRYAAAQDLTAILSQTWRRPEFLPFMRYNLMYSPAEMRLNVSGTPIGLITGRVDTNDTDGQRFSFEQNERLHI